MINYFANPWRSSPLNLLITRVTIAIYAIWKLLSYDFARLQEWPGFFYEQHPHGDWVFNQVFLTNISIEVWLAILLCICFGLGWHTKIVAFILAVLLTHLTAVHYIVTNSAATFIPTIYLLVLWGVYIHTDPYQFTFKMGFSTPAKDKVNFDMTILKWFLVIIAATYFFTGYAKVIKVGLPWLNPNNMAILIHREALMHLEVLPFAGNLLIDMPVMLAISAAGTLFLELGFLVAVLWDKPLWPFFWGLVGFHTMIALTMNIFFFDQYILLALFFPWDTWLTSFKTNRKTATLISS